MKVNSAEKLVSTKFKIFSFEDIDLVTSVNIFEEYKEEAVIKNNTKFADNIWRTTDEYSNISLNFRFSEVHYQKYWKEITGMHFNEFICFIKIYVLSLFGLRSLHTIQTLIRELKYIFKSNPNNFEDAFEQKHIYTASSCINFISEIPTFEKSEHLQNLNKHLEKFVKEHFDNSEDSQRLLADFDSYFLFDEILKDYWASDLSIDDRMFYFPLYLWWNLTGVIPLRPREFLLIERNCLTVSNTKAIHTNYNFKPNSSEITTIADTEDSNKTYTLRLRRNKIKGNSKKKTYKIENDYDISTYNIPKSFGDEIQWYIDNTQNFDSTDLNTLFVTDYHYKKWKLSKPRDSRYLTYANMNTILKYFYKEVIEERYNINVVAHVQKKHLKEREITYIHLGDSRHIALINAMQQGGNPVIAMSLAGHDNVNTASNYYSNILNFIECKTYKEYRKVLSGEVSYSISKFNAYFTDKGVELSDGKMCYSPQYVKEDYSDCINAVGPNGEIGYCPRCGFYGKKDYLFRTMKIFIKTI